MKAIRLEMIALCLATALGAQVSFAQQTDQSQDQSSSGSMKGASSQTTGSAGDVRLSKLKGTEVKASNGDNLGKIEDVLINPQTGKITFALIGRGGVLGLGEKHHPVPWQALTMNSQNQFTLNMDKEKFRSAPTAKSDYSDLNNQDYIVTIYRFYEIQPVEAGAPGETPGGTSGGSTQSQPHENSGGSSGSNQ